MMKSKELKTKIYSHAHSPNQSLSHALRAAAGGLELCEDLPDGPAADGVGLFGFTHPCTHRVMGGFIASLRGGI